MTPRHSPAVHPPPYSPDHDGASSDYPPLPDPAAGAPGPLARLVETLQRWQLLIALVSGFLGGSWLPTRQLGAMRADIARAVAVTDALGRKACIELPTAEAQKYRLPCDQLLRGEYFPAAARLTTAEVTSR